MMIIRRAEEKRLHGPGFEPGTPAVLRQCHNQLDHPRWTLTFVSDWLKVFPSRGRGITLLITHTFNANIRNLEQ